MSGQPLPGRSCDACTMCCKLLAVPQVEKRADVWCRHCAVGKGCEIYDGRPEQCRAFFCQYLLQEQIGEHWKPSKSRMVVTISPDAKHVMVLVDSARANSWRAEPYYGDIKRWAQGCTETGQQLLVKVGDRYHAIMTDRDIDLGAVADDQVIWTTTEWSGGVPRRVVKVISAADRVPIATAYPKLG